VTSETGDGEVWAVSITFTQAATASLMRATFPVCSSVDSFRARSGDLNVA
jgi:hypothetical protein